MQNFRHLLRVLLAVLPLGVADHVHAQNTVATDKAGLVALYNDTDGANWTDSTNWGTDQALSTWHGVTTDGDGRVTRLELHENGLNGTLPTELENLTHLESLLLDRNYALMGPLPDGLRELPALATVELADTELCAPGDDAFQTWLAGISFSGLICPPESQTVIDVAVFYTPAARDHAGGTAAIEAEIDLMAAETNLAYRASGVNQRIALAAVEEVEYTAKGATREDIDRLQDPSDGHMDEVHTTRDQVAADIVVLIVIGHAGIAYDILTPANASAANAFATSGVNSRTFAHELGHLMGLDHDRYVACVFDPSGLGGDGCSEAATAYAYGYVNQQAFEEDAPVSARWRTVMAYDSQCHEADCPQLLRFSNPDQIHLDPGGDPLGVPGREPSTALDGPADAVRTLNRTRATVANFRTPPAVTVSFGAAAYIAAESGAAATVTVNLSPAPERPVSVPLVSVGATGATASDYTAPGSVAFAATETAQTFTVTGTPQLGLTVGSGTPRQMTHRGGGGEVLTFAYTVAEDDSDTDGVSIAADSLSGTIRDSANEDAMLTHMAVEADAGHRVDGVRPLLQGAVADGNRLTLTYAEALHEGSLTETQFHAPDAFTVTSGGNAVRVDQVAVMQQTVLLDLSGWVWRGDAVTVSYRPGAWSIRDPAGTEAAAFSDRSATNETPQPHYDADHDGLIEITTLAQLDAVRHDLDGDGTPSGISGAAVYRAAFPLAFPDEQARRLGCHGACIGYELLADLDFLDVNGDGRVDTDDDTNGDGRVAADDTTWWNGGAGWDPIRTGGQTSYFAEFFEGNGHAIRHLFINRPSKHGVGLFANSSSNIRNVGVIEIDVTGHTAVGGLVGTNTGRIEASYATGPVSGTINVGGLVGGSGGPITTSYATGPVSGEVQVGGLVGLSASGEINASYWDTTTSGQATGSNGQGQTTTQLQTPTGYTGLYADWNVDLDDDGTNDDPWDFGTSSQYPVLKANLDGQGAATWQEFGRQLREGPTLTANPGQGQVGLSWTAVTASHWTPAPSVTYTLTRNDGATSETLGEGLSGLTFTDIDVTAGATYVYQVAAVINGGEASRSPQVSVVLPMPGMMPSVTLQLMPTSIGENGGSAAVTAQLSLASTETTTVTVSATSVSPAVAGDFTLSTNKTLTITAGQTASTRTVTITANNNGVDAPNKTVMVTGTATNSAGVTGPSDMTLTIIDDDATPVITTAALIPVAENETVVATLQATDEDDRTEDLEWEITGGKDRSQFTLTGGGWLAFTAAKDYEEPDDSDRDGDYEVTVQVSDGFNAVQVEFTVRVSNEREPPDVPEAPTFSGETEDSLRVSWAEPDNSGPPITDYDVQYREGDSGVFTDAQHEGPALTAMLTGLKEGTVYQVQVRASNEEGRSNWSEPGEGRTIVPLRVQMTTDPPTPVEGPFTFRFSFSEAVRGFTSDDIAAQQEPPCPDSANNPVSCDPTITALQTTDDRIFTTTVAPRTASVAHNYTLTISVRANRVTSVVDNRPNEAATIAVRVAPPGVTVPISSIGLTASTGNGRVTLRWNAPQNIGGAPIVRYEYRWTEPGGISGDWIRVAPVERAATVPNLTNGREYVFEVRGVNALGYGGVETVQTTPSRPPGGGPPPVPNPVPSAPSNLEALGGDRQVTLSWEAPEDDGGFPVTDYQYLISRSGRGWISTGSTETTHTVTELTNGRLYVLQVRAVSGAGAGASSHQVEVTPGVGRLEFAHFANGLSITSDLVLVNVFARPIRPSLYFYDREGERIAAESVVELTEELEVAEDGSLTVQSEMQPLQALTISTHGQGELVAGSVTVLSNGPIGGVLRFDLPGVGVAGVGAGQPLRDALFPARRQAGGISTAVAIRNLEAEELVVSCQLMQEGAVLQEVDIELKVNGQDGRFIEEVFTTTDTTDFVGMVRCTAPAGKLFVGVAVELDAGNGIFTTLPVLPLDRTVFRGGEYTLDFAHFANGASITSDLVLVNVSIRPSRPAGPFTTPIPPTRPSLYFYDRAGERIAAESVVEVTGDLEVAEDGSLTVQSELEPLQAVTISTHGQGEVVAGSVRVVAEGPIGGVLRFDLPGVGVAGVRTGQPLTDALFPARRQEGGISTAAAIRNLEAEELVVSCRLMQEGAVLEEVDIELQANGQDGRFIEEVFTRTDTSDFVGLVRCTAEGEFAGVAVELDAGASIFTTLPVVPVER